jgi:hypothetical protein
VIEPRAAGAGELARDVWATLACVENFLMRDFDGVIYNGQGIYDADHRTLARRRQQ